MEDSKNTSSDRLRIFIKKAGGPAKVSKLTGLSLSTVSNISRPNSDPAFKVSCAILKAYPALNPRWWFLGGDEPMWIDKPVNVDPDLVDIDAVGENIETYKTNSDYSNFNKDELIKIINEKNTLLDKLLGVENKTIKLLSEQLEVLKNILQSIDKQRETSKDTK